jgi:hypothetical protein
MKSAIRYLVGAVVAAVLGGVCLASGFLQRDMAHAQQEVALQKYGDADATFERAERYFEYGSRIPGVGNRLLNDVRARRAAAHYWQQQYGMFVPDQGDPTSAIPRDNLDLQFIVANGVYRAHQSQVKDRASMIEALNAGINSYLVVLKNSTRRDDAAFNYEYLLRLREDIEKGRRKPDPGGGEVENPLGAAASPEKAPTDMKNFKTYVPLTPNELDKADSGKGQPIKRKG